MSSQVRSLARICLRDEVNMLSHEAQTHHIIGNGTEWSQVKLSEESWNLEGHRGRCVVVVLRGQAAAQPRWSFLLQSVFFLTSIISFSQSVQVEVELQFIDSLIRLFIKVQK